MAHFPVLPSADLFTDECYLFVLPPGSVFLFQDTLFEVAFCNHRRRGHSRAVPVTVVAPSMDHGVIYSFPDYFVVNTIPNAG